MIFMALFRLGFVFPMQHPVEKRVPLVQHFVATGFSVFNSTLLPGDGWPEQCQRVSCLQTD